MRNGRYHVFVQRPGNNAFGGGLGHQPGQSLGPGNLHAIGDSGGPNIQGSPENPGESQAVVNLVGEVAASGANYHRPGFLGQVGHYFRSWVGGGEDGRPWGHGAHHILSYDASSGQAHKNIGQLHRVGQTSCNVVRVGYLQHFGLDGIEVGAALVDQALAVHQQYVGCAVLHQQPGRGNAAGAGSRKDYLDLFNLLANHLQRIDYRRQDNYRRAVLVVVENRNAQVLQGGFNFKTTGR